MSMNVRLVAKRDIYVPIVDKYDVQYQSIELWETPTDVTRAITESDFPFKEYSAWVQSVSEDREIDLYETADAILNNEPTGVGVINEGKDHLEDLSVQIEFLESVGYKIKWEVL